MYDTISDFDFVRIREGLGVHLQASWLKSRKKNNDELVTKLKSLIGVWKSGKFMSLIYRPFSVNSYAMSKIW